MVPVSNYDLYSTQSAFSFLPLALVECRSSARQNVESADVYRRLFAPIMVKVDALKSGIDVEGVVVEVHVIELYDGLATWCRCGIDSFCCPFCLFHCGTESRTAVQTLTRFTDRHRRRRDEGAHKSVQDVH